MDFIPDTVEIEELELEVATISVVWREGSQNPLLDYTGCSGYEAEGLLRAALKQLARNNAKAVRFFDESLEYEDEEEVEDGELDD